LWDYIARIPAVKFSQYAYVAPTLFDSTQVLGQHWSAFKVSAHMSNGQFFFSVADSGYSIDNLSPDPPAHVIANRLPNIVNIQWDVPVDPDVSYFAVYRVTVKNFIPTEVTKIGTSQTNTYADQNLGTYSALYYRVSAVDKAGNEGALSTEIGTIVTGVGSRERLPTVFNLYQNYPNPFNPSARIKFDVSNEAEVTLKIYDIIGREVTTLVNERKPAGRYEISWKADNMPSGVYLVRMNAGKFTSLVKMLLLK
jgi:hypothetical protein